MGAGAAALASLASDFLNAGVSIWNQERTNQANRAIADKNIDLTRETNAWNERLMREAWARDDTARQRMVADLESAGLSKWLATGASPGSSSPVSMTSPQDTHTEDYNLKADAFSHMYQNILNAQQTEKQNDILDIQGKVAQEDLAIKEAEKKIKQHDAEVFANRPDVASSDPQYMKMFSEALNILTGKDKGNVAGNTKSYIENKAREKLNSSYNILDSLFGGVPTKIFNYFNGERKPKEKKKVQPMSYPEWLKANQLSGNRESAYYYQQYKKNFD